MNNLSSHSLYDCFRSQASKILIDSADISTNRRHMCTTMQCTVYLWVAKCYSCANSNAARCCRSHAAVDTTVPEIRKINTHVRLLCKTLIHEYKQKQQTQPRNFYSNQNWNLSILLHFIISIYTCNWHTAKLATSSNITTSSQNSTYRLLIGHSVNHRSISEHCKQAFSNYKTLNCYYQPHQTLLRKLATIYGKTWLAHNSITTVTSKHKQRRQAYVNDVLSKGTYDPTFVHSLSHTRTCTDILSAAQIKVHAHGTSCIFSWITQAICSHAFQFTFKQQERNATMYYCYTNESSRPHIQVSRVTKLIPTKHTF